MKCREARKHLEGYLSGDLEGDVLRRVEDHLEECSRCREEFALQGELRKRLEEMPAVEARSDFPDRVMRRIRNRKGKRFRLPGLSLTLPGTVLLRAGAALALAVPVLLFFLIEKPYYWQQVPGPESVERIPTLSRDMPPSGDRLPSPKRSGETSDEKLADEGRSDEDKREKIYSAKKEGDGLPEGPREKPAGDRAEAIVDEGRQDKKWELYEVRIVSTVESVRRDSSQARQGAPAVYRNSKAGERRGDEGITARSDRERLEQVLEKEGARDIRLDREGDRPVIRYRANEATQRRIERALAPTHSVEKETPAEEIRPSGETMNRLQIKRKK